MLFFNDYPNSQQVPSLKALRNETFTKATSRREATYIACVEEYPENKHWTEHVLTAAFHIKENHPDPYIREYWGSILSVCNSRIKNWKKQEKKRKELEEYIERVTSKYIDIYTRRYI